MQAARLLLHQHRLLNLQVCLLLAKVDLAVLPRLTELDELFRPGTKGTHPGKGVLLGSLGLGVSAVAFRVHPPEGTLEDCQSF
jgi:hypothetical protein